MAGMTDFWAGLPARSKLGLAAGAAAIVASVAAAGYWAMSSPYRALFTDLAEPDAATLVAELDRMKVPYRLAAGGRHIEVPGEIVHRTRLQLVSKDLPLHGAVGFEIFNNTDFGMTEFNQRVNYQRALQGELTRTILSIDPVQAARVHLVLPESSLFKREQTRPKASVTLGLRAGRVLERAHVLGIQRLVSAAVPGVEVADVTVLDQTGSTLSRRDDGSEAAAGWQLETKHAIEDYLARKAALVLDRAYGAGQGLVSVDVALHFDQVKTTTEEMLGARGSQKGQAGILVRERQTVRDTPAKPGAADEAVAAVPAVTQSDTEYQAGRRVEQIVAAPGSVRRMNVAVVLPKGVSAERLQKVRTLVAAAVGLDAARGDSMAVHSLDQLSDGAIGLAAPVPGDIEALPPTAAGLPQPPQAEPGRPQLEGLQGMLALQGAWQWLLPALLAVLALAGWAAWERRARRQAARQARTAVPALLPPAQRQAALDSVQRWLLAAEGAHRGGPAS
jgi:flagellar M-ring protein FliF